MAETALGMAITLVGSALAVASSAAREEIGLLLGVQDDIWFISDELKLMQAFLRAADGARENIGMLKAYSELIRDLAYDIEDSLEEFMVFVKNKSFVQQLLSLQERHRIAVQIHTLKLRVQELSQRNMRYNAIKLTPSTSSNVIGDTEFTRNFAALNVEEAQLVGLDEPKKKLMELIGKVKEPKEHETSNVGPRVVSLVGMGGIGKTALTKKVFDSKDLSEMFGTHAWITVSQSFDRKEIFKEMIKQLFGAESLKKLLEDLQGQQALEVHLAGYLSKRLKETRLQCGQIYSSSSGIKLPRGVGKLKELQVLEKVDIKQTSRKAIKELGELTQLRKIVVRGRGASKKNCKAFCEAAPKLSSLRSLDVSTKDYLKAAEVLDNVVSFTSPLPSLVHLKLKGCLQNIPAWVGKCGKLVKLELKYCQLKELEPLAEVPNLVQLRLQCKAFNAETLVFREHGFPKLRILLIQYHSKLLPTEVTFEQSTSPNMETIDIGYCDLTTGINGIKHLPKLKKICIHHGYLGKQDMLREEVENHTNHPVLQMRDVSEPGESSES